MNRHERRLYARAQRATWKVFADAAAETVGFQTPVHQAALRAATTGAAEDAAAFSQAAEDLPPDDRDRLLDHLQALDAKRQQVACAYADAGRV